ncbi:MAG: hypothetical protein Q8P82_02045 [bacterium]|nr:hypothetical protein [bacterium]
MGKQIFQKTGKNIGRGKGVNRSKISEAFTPRIAPSWWGKETKGLEKIVVCPKCHALYYDKHWHSWSQAKGLAERLRKLSVVEEMCTECRWSHDAGSESKRSYEGEVILAGWGTLEEKREIIQIIRNVGNRATRRDPEDQIIRIDDQGNKIRVLTTENQLAVSIGKQVDRARKGGRLEIIFSEQDAIARVRWIAGKAMEGKRQKSRGAAA